MAAAILVGEPADRTPFGVHPDERYAAVDHGIDRPVADIVVTFENDVVP